jgi:hypothetical protein
MNRICLYEETTFFWMNFAFFNQLRIYDTLRPDYLKFVFMNELRFYELTPFFEWTSFLWMNFVFMRELPCYEQTAFEKWLSLQESKKFSRKTVLWESVPFYEKVPFERKKQCSNGKNLFDVDNFLLANKLRFDIGQFFSFKYTSFQWINFLFMITFIFSFMNVARF